MKTNEGHDQVLKRAYEEYETDWRYTLRLLPTLAWEKRADRKAEAAL